jgi:hypothetical protein
MHIRVGTGDDAKIFHIDKNSICKSSGYFAEVCLSKSSDRIDLAGDDPAAFDLFFQWMRRPERPVPYSPGQYSEEPWLSKASAAWLLARKLRAEDFELYALSQFIQNCALAAFGPWKDIEREAPRSSPIRRFSDHWVAWNSHLAGPGRNEFSDLQVAWKARLVTDNTKDPRIYDIEHWYLRCGDDLSPNCSHDPDAQQAKLNEANHREEPPREWGRSFEEQREGRPARGSSSNKSPLQRNLSRRTSSYVPPIRSTPTVRRYSPVRGLSPVQSTYTNPNVQLDTASTSDGDSCCGHSWGTVILGVSVLAPTPRASCSHTQVIFGVQVTIMLALSLDMLSKSGYGISNAGRNYSLFAACVAGLTLFVPHTWPAYVLFGLANGIATAIDTSKCWSAWHDGNTDSSQPCREITALTVFVWLSLPVSAAYSFMILHDIF